MALFGARRPTLTQRVPRRDRCDSGSTAEPAVGNMAAEPAVGSMAAGGTTAVRANPASRSSVSLNAETASPSTARRASPRSSPWARSWCRASALSHAA